MGSKTKIALLIPCMLVVLLFISPEVAARDLKESEVVEERNDVDNAEFVGNGAYYGNQGDFSLYGFEDGIPRTGGIPITRPGVGGGIPITRPRVGGGIPITRPGVGGGIPITRPGVGGGYP